MRVERRTQIGPGLLPGTGLRHPAVERREEIGGSRLIGLAEILHQGSVPADAAAMVTYGDFGGALPRRTKSHPCVSTMKYL